MNTLGIDPGVPEDSEVYFETFDALRANTYVGGRGLFQGRNGIDTVCLRYDQPLKSLGQKYIKPW